MSIVVFFFLVILLSSSGYTVSYGSYFQKRRQSSVAKKITQRPKINQEINFPEVRVVLSSSDNRSDISLGVLSMERALFEAENRSLDLVLINEAALPPVCKIIDAGKHMYCVEKRAKDMQKRQSKSDIKEIKLSFNIDDHDVNVRVKLAEKFMEAGDRVRVIVAFKGREMKRKELSKDILEKFLKGLDGKYVAESEIKEEARGSSIIIGPKKKNQGSK